MASSSSAFYPTTGPTGFFVYIAPGSLLIGGVYVSFNGTNVTVAANSTSYVFIDLQAQTITSNTTGFPVNSFPLAVAVTNNDVVTSVTDKRPDFIISIG